MRSTSRVVRSHLCVKHAEQSNLPVGASNMPRKARLNNQQPASHLHRKPDDSTKATKMGYASPHFPTLSHLKTRTTNVCEAAPAIISSDSASIRSRYLRRLGVTQPTKIPPTRSKLAAPLSDPASRVETLKDDYGEPDGTITVNSPPLHSPLREKASVCFGSIVTVHEIPKRTEYSERVKSTIWTPFQELEANVTRNSIEFAAENWDWRQVYEESDMVFLQGQEEPVHPVHFMRECNMQRQFLLVMAAQQKMGYH
jgi:hypothetical protein